jgi:hypothetical protein
MIKLSTIKQFTTRDNLDTVEYNPNYPNLIALGSYYLNLDDRNKIGNIFLFETTHSELDQSSSFNELNVTQTAAAVFELRWYKN